MMVLNLRGVGASGRSKVAGRRGARARIDSRVQDVAPPAPSAPLPAKEREEHHDYGLQNKSLLESFSPYPKWNPYQARGVGDGVVGSGVGVVGQ